MSEFMKNRDESPYVWLALDGLDVADFGQLSPAQQSLVLMRAAQISRRTDVQFCLGMTIGNTDFCVPPAFQRYINQRRKQWQTKEYL